MSFNRVLVSTIIVLSRKMFNTLYLIKTKFLINDYLIKKREREMSMSNLSYYVDCPPIPKNKAKLIENILSAGFR